MRVVLALVPALLALVVAGTALAATPPAATTGPVSSVASTSATVTGSVDPNGTATTWLVQYGTTTGYGSKTASTSAGSGASSVPVSATLKSLRPGTTYHYRVVATSSAGTADGADGILTTTAAPAVSTGSASNVTTSSATLAGSLNPNGRPTTWYFEYGPSTRYGAKTAARDGGSGTATFAVSANVTGLQAGATYHYRLVATSDAGTTHGADRTFVAFAKPTARTSAASVLSDTSARAAGSVSPNGRPTTAWFQYGTTTGYGSRTAAISVGSGTSAQNVTATLPGLAGATTYHVRLVASNSAGTSYGADVAFTTTGRPHASSSAATNVTGTTVTLNGAVDPDGHATTWYAEWGTSTAYGNRTAAQSVGDGTSTAPVSVPLTGLLAGTAYHFRIVATNASGAAQSGDVSFTTAGPGVTLAAAATTVLSGGSVRLSGTTIAGQANEPVTLWAQPFGQSSFVQLATVLTGAGGTWAYDARPRLATTYKAQVAAGPSPTLAVTVRPTVSLHASRGRVVVRVTAAVSYARRLVLLQRRRGSGWADLGFHRLGAHGGATLAPKLRKGRWTLRVLVGSRPGLRAGTSNLLTIRRR